MRNEATDSSFVQSYSISSFCTIFNFFSDASPPSPLHHSTRFSRSWNTWIRRWTPRSTRHLKEEIPLSDSQRCPRVGPCLPNRYAYPRKRWAVEYAVRLAADLTNGSHLALSHDCKNAWRGYNFYLFTVYSTDQQLNMIKAAIGAPEYAMRMKRSLGDGDEDGFPSDPTAAFGWWVLANSMPNFKEKGSIYWDSGSVFWNISSKMD